MKLGWSVTVVDVDVDVLEVESGTVGFGVEWVEGWVEAGIDVDGGVGSEEGSEEGSDERRN